MNYLINQLMTVDKAFYRHYLEMLLTLNRILMSHLSLQDDVLYPAITVFIHTRIILYIIGNEFPLHLT